MRLDKYIAGVTDLSRKEVKRMLHAGAVSVNGAAERDPGRKVDTADRVCLQGVALEPPASRYIMLHKPAGVVCANRDPACPTVMELLEMARVERLHICGRLDRDTTGLVLLSDDGQWAHRVTSPNRHTGKIYQVTTCDPIPAAAEHAFAAGILLQGERRRTRPAQLERLSPREARVCLHEGRYHQIKRMFAALGNRVVALHRQQIGAIVLDERLEPGQYRHLTPSEIASV
jgi:16S rRNA pseudouridine516 synthase